MNPNTTDAMAVRGQRKLRTGISTAFAKRLDSTAEGEPVVQTTMLYRSPPGKNWILVAHQLQGVSQDLVLVIT
jgi:hypothetical protein